MHLLFRIIPGRAADLQDPVASCTQTTLSTVSSTKLEIRAEMHFQIARIAFAQYNSVPSWVVLKNVVTSLSHCIEANIELGNGNNLDKAISFLFSVMLKTPFGAAFPKEIGDDRKRVTEDLRSWEWGFSIESAKQVLEKGQLPQSIVLRDIQTLDSVMNN